jgi:hypothetical protein
MNRTAILRIESLQARKATEYKPAPPPPLSAYIVGYFGGRYDAKASQFENYSHALGCQSGLEFHSLTAEQVAERHRGHGRAYAGAARSIPTRYSRGTRSSACCASLTGPESYRRRRGKRLRLPRRECQPIHAAYGLHLLHLRTCEYSKVSQEISGRAKSIE